MREEAGIKTGATMMFPMRKYREFRYSGLGPQPSPINNPWYALHATGYRLSASMTFATFMRPINSPSRISAILRNQKFNLNPAVGQEWSVQFLRVQRSHVPQKTVQSTP
jgi:hypothetical protein